MRQRILQWLRSICTNQDPVIRMQAPALRLITAQTLDVPFVQIASQILDLLVHEPYYWTWEPLSTDPSPLVDEIAVLYCSK